MIIMTLGDSLTAGYPFRRSESWVAQLAKAFPEHQWLNEGIDGDTLQGMIFRWEERLYKKEPHIVFAMGGTNNILMGRTSDYCFETYKKLGQAIQATGVQLVIGLPMEIAYDEPLTKVLLAYEERLRQWARAEGIGVIDFYGPFRKARQEGLIVFHGDVHPNRRGYEIMFHEAKTYFTELWNEKEESRIE